MMEETGRRVEAWCTCPEAVDKYAIKTWKHLMCLWKGQATGSLCASVCVCTYSLAQSALILPFLHLSCSCLQFWSLYYGQQCIFMSLDEIWVRVTEEHADCQRHFTVYMLWPMQRDWGRLIDWLSHYKDCHYKDCIMFIKEEQDRFHSRQHWDTLFIYLLK